MAYANKNTEVYQSRSLLATAMQGNQVQNAAGGYYNPNGYPEPQRNWPGYHPQGWSSQTAWAPSSNIGDYGITPWQGSPPHAFSGLGSLSTTVAALPTWQKVGGVVLGLWVLGKILK